MPLAIALEGEMAHVTGEQKFRWLVFLISNLGDIIIVTTDLATCTTSGYLSIRFVMDSDDSIMIGRLATRRNAKHIYSDVSNSASS